MMDRYEQLISLSWRTPEPMQSIPCRLWFRGYSTNVGMDPDVSYINMRDALMNINEGTGIFPVGHLEVEVSLLLLPVTPRVA